MNAEMRVPADSRYFSMVIRIYIEGNIRFNDNYLYSLISIISFYVKFCNDLLLAVTSFFEVSVMFGHWLMPDTIG
jgi:hypothetical protein